MVNGRFGVRNRVLLVVASAGLAFLQMPLPVTARAVATPNDFDGDGYADLAIGVPGEDVGSKVNANEDTEGVTWKTLWTP